MKKILSVALFLLCAVNANAATRSITAFPTITPVTDDYFIFSDTSASGAFGRTTLANVKTALGVPAAADLLVGSCTGLPCLDGTSDGGDLIKLYGPGGFWTALQAGNSTANRSWRLPLAAAPSAGTTRLMNMDENGQMGFVDPASFLTPTGVGGALTVTATGFDGNLATTDNTIQEIAQKFDDFAGGGGYTNLTSFVAQTPWRLFYSNTDGDVTELALGSDGEYLKSNGASAAPTWATPSGAAHDAVTLGTDADVLLGLSTQQLTLDSQTANYIFAAPNGAAGDPTFRAMVAADVPTLNQNTTGTAGGLSGTPNITVGTISAGATGFSVDADGDVTAKTYLTSAADGARKSELPNNTTASPTGGGVEEIYNEAGAIKAVENDTEYDMLLSRDFAAASDINTGTSTTTVVTPDALAGSNLGTKEVAWTIKDSDVVTAVADGKQAFAVPASMNGMELVDCTATVADLNSAASGSTTVVLRRVRGATAADMTSTGVTVAYNEYSASDETVDTANDDLATGDKLYPDVNAVTSAVHKGLSLTCLFRIP